MLPVLPLGIHPTRSSLSQTQFEGSSPKSSMTAVIAAAVVIIETQTTSVLSDMHPMHACILMRQNKSKLVQVQEVWATQCSSYFILPMNKKKKRRGWGFLIHRPRGTRINGTHRSNLGPAVYEHTEKKGKGKVVGNKIYLVSSFQIGSPHCTPPNPPNPLPSPAKLLCCLPWPGWLGAASPPRLPPM